MNEQSSNQSPVAPVPERPVEPVTGAPRGTSFVMPPTEITPTAPLIPQPDLDPTLVTKPAAESYPPQFELTSVALSTEREETASPDLDSVGGQVAPLTWQASEYIHHQKGASWYIGLISVVVVLLVFAVIFKLWLSIAVFLAMGVTIAVYAHKPPRVLTYFLDDQKVGIENHQYPYKDFRSFAVLSDIEWHAIDLEPTQRFMPRLTLLFADEDFDAIVGHLSLHLPRTDRKPDLIERVTRYLRF